MKKNWLILSLTVGLLSAILSYFLLHNWIISSIVFIIIFIIVLRLSSHRRYMSAFWAILTTLIFLNKYSVEIIGDILNIEFKIKSTEINNWVSVSLVILLIVTLILDFLERRKDKGALFSSKRVIIKNTGDSYYSEEDISIKKHTDK